jgi:predicted metal-dependent peptidase
MSRYKEVVLTAEQAYKAEIVRIGFMASCPFFAHFFYSECKEFFTLDVPMAATDGRRLYINPEYLMTLKPAEGVFVYAHEMYHVVSRHPQRMAHYMKSGKLAGLDYDQFKGNQAADYTINADLVESQVGMINAAWLWASDVKGSEAWEEVYKRKYKKELSGPGQGGGGQGPGQGQGGAPGQGQGQGQPQPQPKPQPGETWGGSGKSAKGAKQDPRAQAQGGGFDDVLPPEVDPVTGAEDIPSDSEFREAIARAAAAAKSVGNLPGRIKRLIDEILEPQVNWRDHIRMLMTGKIGAKSETWDKPNRRYAALGALSRNGFPVMPGRRGHGANTVAVAIDTSGSIGPNELAAFLAEVGGVLNDVRPKRIVVMGCDTRITQVEEVTTLDELAELRRKGVKGGGGTRFEPPFDYLAKEGIRPEALIYLTDLEGSVGAQPAYPVIWACTTNKVAPWGDTVAIKIEA